MFVVEWNIAFILNHDKINVTTDSTQIINGDIDSQTTPTEK